MTTMYTQVQGPQIVYQRAPPPPPPQFPVQPTYPRTTSGYMSAIPRLQPAARPAPQLDMGTVNHHPPPPAAISQPQVQARASEHSFHPPPYTGYHGGGFIFTLGPPDISEPRYPRSPSSPPYGGLGPSCQFFHPSESTHHLTHQQAIQEVYVRQPNHNFLLNENASPNQPNWPSTRTLSSFAYH